MATPGPASIHPIIYPLRTAGYLLAASSVYLAHKNDLSLGVYAAAFLLLCQPHYAAMRVQIESSPASEARNMLIDMALVGVIGALVSFSPVILACYLLPNSAGNLATGGVRFAAKGFGVFVIGALVGGALFGFELKWPVTPIEYVPAAFYFALAVHFMGYLNHIRARDLVRSQRAAENLAYLDPLTGIRNRRSFDAEMERSWNWCEERREPLSLILLDVDFFKRFNDHHGHPAGDDCLRRVANAIRRVSESRGLMASRTGGEEFGVMVSGVDPTTVVAIAEQIRTAIQALGIKHGSSFVADNVTASVGVATALPSERFSPRGLLLAADEALYQAKESGRNRVEARTVNAPADWAQS